MSTLRSIHGGWDHGARHKPRMCGVHPAVKSIAKDFAPVSRGAKSFFDPISLSLSLISRRNGLLSSTKRPLSFVSTEIICVCVGERGARVRSHKILLQFRLLRIREEDTRCADLFSNLNQTNIKEITIQAQSPSGFGNFAVSRFGLATATRAENDKREIKGKRGFPANCPRWGFVACVSTGRRVTLSE